MTPTPSNAASEFVFASWLLSDDASSAALQEAIDRYAETSGATITTATYSYDEYRDRLLEQVTGDEFSGALHIDSAWLPDFAATGRLAEVGSLARGAGFTDRALLIGESSGNQLGLPLTNAAIGLIANQDLLDAAEIVTMPTTLDAFEEVLRALKDSSADVVPYAGLTEQSRLHEMLVWMQTFGSPIIDGGTCVIGDDASVQAMIWYKSLLDDGLIAPDMGRDAARSLFAQGKVGFYDDVPAARDAVLEADPDGELSEAMMPVPRPVLKADDDPHALACGQLIILVDSDASSAAGEFAKWLTSDEEQTVAFFEELGSPPSTDAALNNESVKQDSFISAFSEKITATAMPSPLAGYAKHTDMEAALAEQIASALHGDASPSDAMKAAGEAITNLMV